MWIIFGVMTMTYYRFWEEEKAKKTLVIKAEGMRILVGRSFGIMIMTWLYFRYYRCLLYFLVINFRHLQSAIFAKLTKDKKIPWQHFKFPTMPHHFSSLSFVYTGSETKYLCLWASWKYLQKKTMLLGNREREAIISVCQ